MIIKCYHLLTLINHLYNHHYTFSKKYQLRWNPIPKVKVELEPFYHRPLNKMICLLLQTRFLIKYKRVSQLFIRRKKKAKNNIKLANMISKRLSFRMMMKILKDMAQLLLELKIPKLKNPNNRRVKELFHL